MNTVSDNLLSVILAHEISYGELSRLTGIPKSALQRYATGRTRKIPFDRIRLIAETIGVDPSVLTGCDTDAPVREQIPLAGEKKKIPLIGTVCSGEGPLLSGKNILRMENVPDGMEADFCFYCRGEDVPDARIRSGDLVYVRCQPDADNGQIAVVLLGGTLTLKRVYRYPKRNRLVLQAEHPQAAPVVLEGEAAAAVRVIGVAVGFTVKL